MLSRREGGREARRRHTVQQQGGWLPSLPPCTHRGGAGVQQPQHAHQAQAGPDQQVRATAQPSGPHVVGQQGGGAASPTKPPRRRRQRRATDRPPSQRPGRESRRGSHVHPTVGRRYGGGATDRQTAERASTPKGGGGGVGPASRQGGGGQTVPTNSALTTHRHVLCLPKTWGHGNGLGRAGSAAS